MHNKFNNSLNININVLLDSTANSMIVLMVRNLEILLIEFLSSIFFHRKNSSISKTLCNVVAHSTNPNKSWNLTRSFEHETEFSGSWYYRAQWENTVTQAVNSNVADVSHTFQNSHVLLDRYTRCAPHYFLCPCVLHVLSSLSLLLRLTSYVLRPTSYVLRFIFCNTIRFSPRLNSSQHSCCTSVYYSFDWTSNS